MLLPVEDRVGGRREKHQSGSVTEASQSEGQNGGGSSLGRLSASRSELARRLQETRERLQTLEERRAEVQSLITALEGEAAARRAELRFQSEDAQTRLETYLGGSSAHEKAWADARRARRELADVEANLARRMPEVIADRDVIDTQIESTRNTEQSLLEDLSIVDNAIRRLEAEEHAARARNLESQLAELEPVVREAAGSGIADLSEDYASQATRHGNAWRIWGSVLLLALAGAVVGSLLLFSSERIPTGAIDSETVVTIARNLLVVGLLLYAVRLASLQFRVHRHLEAVARNKAAALSTFNRIVGVSGEQEVRNAIATVLAQAVFSSEDTGFIDGADSHITLVERIAAGIPSRFA